MEESEQMSEVTTSDSNTGVQTFTTLVDGVVDKALLYTVQHRITIMCLGVNRIFCLGCTFFLKNVDDLFLVVDGLKLLNKPSYLL